MWIIKTGIIFSIFSIAIGAFGAHALANIIAEKNEVFKTNQDLFYFEKKIMFWGPRGRGWVLRIGIHVEFNFLLHGID